MATSTTERRKASRKRTSSLIWWKTTGQRLLQQGWLIERASNSVGFLCRATSTPTANEELSLITTNGKQGAYLLEEGVVRRTSHVHQDVHLVAATVAPATTE